MEILAVKKCKHPALRKGFYIRAACLLDLEPRMLYVFGDTAGYCIQLFFVDADGPLDDPAKWMSGAADKDSLNGEGILQGLSVEELQHWIIELGVL